MNVPLSGAIEDPRSNDVRPRVREATVTICSSNPRSARRPGEALHAPGDVFQHQKNLDAVHLYYLRLSAGFVVSDILFEWSVLSF